MASRNDRMRAQSASSARQPANIASPNPAPAVPGRVRAAKVVRPASTGVGALPLEKHRLVASIALVLLLALSIFAPLSSAAPSPAPFITPQIDGSGSVQPGFTNADIERAVFPYLTVIERSQGNLGSTWPSLADALNFPPDSARARGAIVGQIYASSSGSLDLRIKDSGLEPNPPADKLQGIESVYSNMLNTSNQEAKGINGLAAMGLIRSLQDNGDRRKELENQAVGVFGAAIDSDPGVPVQNGTEPTWQFSYNWGLANLLAGNYAQAYDAIRNVSALADKGGNKLSYFWMGLAALRMGDPGLALNDFNTAATQETPLGSTPGIEQEYQLARDLATEGLGDAQLANRDPEAAYDTYLGALTSSSDITGLYSKWLALGLQQRAYERMIADLQTLETSSNLSREARVHHDRARLLVMLGRTSEALAEYRQAIAMAGNDAGLLISYGQALESIGDHGGAIQQAQDALRALGQQPEQADLLSAATAAVTYTTSLAAAQSAQELLDANLLRARVWGAQGKTDQVQNLVGAITQQAASQPPNKAGLLNLYGAFAYEAAGLRSNARESYSAAWDKLKALPPGSAGRAAALAGLARTTAFSSGKSAADGAAVIKANGYDLQSLKSSVIADTDAPDILYQYAVLLGQAGQAKDAANVQRVAAVVRDLQDVRRTAGIGRPLWSANGTSVPAMAMLYAADADRAASGSDNGLTVLRYKQSYQLDPSMAAAWNNLGALYAQQGDASTAQFYLSAASKISPSYVWGEHNLAALAYTQGPGSFFTAEGAEGQAIKSVGAPSLLWGYEVRPDERGPLPAPSLPPTDPLTRLPAVIILALLLLHTLIGKDRLTNRMGVLPARGVLGKLAVYGDGWVRDAMPGLVAPRAGSRGLMLAIGIPSLVGMLALAWGAGHGSLVPFLVYLPVALIASMIAFGGNELAQYLAARRVNGTTLRHVWPLGLIIGVLSIPFGFVYGWQNVTRVQPAATTEGNETKAGRRVIGRRTRTSEELDLAYEAQAEAAVEAGSLPVATTPLEGVAPPRDRLGLSPAARILAAGLAANLLIGLLFGLFYWITGWPSLRLAMFASMLVLAFTAVSEPPADGWSLYRRNSMLWLALFVFAATVVTLLAAWII